MRKTLFVCHLILLSICLVQLKFTTRIWFYNSGHSTDFTTDVPTSTLDTLNVNEAGLWKNFIHRRKCQLEDDWGPIGLNCTDEDIISERVEVIGFLVNWMQTYAFIRSEFWSHFIHGHYGAFKKGSVRDLNVNLEHSKYRAQ